MIEYMKELLDKFLTLLLSPFLPVIQQLSALPYLGYINWFVPVGTFVKIGSMWTAAILAYYAWSVIARWVKLLS